MYLERPPRTREAISWMGVAAWVIFIYGSIPLARAFQQQIYAWGLKPFFLVITLAAFALAALALVRSAVREAWKPRPSQVVVLAVVFGLFVGLTWQLRSNPEEAFHFVQYGVLALLLLRALRHRLADPTLYLAALMFGLFFGILDELIQWLIPRRFFDYRDILINATAVVLCVSGVAWGLRPSALQAPWSPAGARLALRGAMVNLALLLLTVSLTPARVERWASAWPYLATLDEIPSEYGYRIELPEVGVFFSRLPPAELLRQDAERGAEVGPLISEARSDRDYYRFLKKRPAHHDPLPAEARIHIFRRDRHAAEALRQQDLETAKFYAWVAASEHAILEAYFPQTLAHSIYRWSDQRRAAITARLGEPVRYVSAVSRQLITGVSYRSLVVVLGAGLLVAVVAERRLSRRMRS